MLFAYHKDTTTQRYDGFTKSYAPTHCRSSYPPLPPPPLCKKTVNLYAFLFTLIHKEETEETEDSLVQSLCLSGKPTLTFSTTSTQGHNVWGGKLETYPSQTVNQMGGAFFISATISTNLSRRPFFVSPVPISGAYELLSGCLSGKSPVTPFFVDRCSLFVEPSTASPTSL